MKQAAPTTHLRLKPEEELRIEKIRLALAQRSGDAPTTKSHALHVIIAKGCETLAKELGFKS